MGIKFEKVTHTFKNPDGRSRFIAMENIDLNIESTGEFIAVCGHTGSGKSTLIQHMNALLFPSSGKLTIFDRNIKPKKNNKLNEIRKKVGLVFQFPEYQLFDETVLKDVMFGPINFGLKKEEAKEKAIKALEMVDFDPKLYDQSPFRLSGGQMKKASIAGILALEPEIIVLDEPTRGLDPKSSFAPSLILMLVLFLVLALALLIIEVECHLASIRADWCPTDNIAVKEKRVYEDVG